jgi:hypothetical protein
MDTGQIPTSRPKRIHGREISAPEGPVKFRIGGIHRLMVYILAVCHQWRPFSIGG